MLLGSVALRDSVGELVGTADWTKEMWDYAEMTLRTTVLGGIGDRSRERFFRMCITACLHRGLTPRELRLLPAWWHAAPAIDIAGGPLEILRSTGVPEIASARPCVNPHRHILDARRPDLYLPIDCGDCASCKARSVCRLGLMPAMA